MDGPGRTHLFNWQTLNRSAQPDMTRLTLTLLTFWVRIKLKIQDLKYKAQPKP